MKKTITTMAAMALCALSGFAETLNGWLLYSETFNEVGFCQFESDDSKSTLSVTKPWTGSSTPKAAAYVGDKFYMQMSEAAGYSIGVYNEQTGQYTAVKQYAALQPFRDMASDGSTLYAVDINASEDRSYLYTINPSTGDYSTKPLEYSYYCLACNPATGVLYGVEYNGTLLAIDPVAGNEQEVGYLDYYPEDMPQTMCYDTEANLLYWASYTERGSYFLTISPQNGTLYDEQDLGDNNEVKLIGLGIKGAASLTGLPAPVSALSVTPGENGALSALVSWTNPDKTMEGDALNSLTTATITRNGDVIATVAATGAGAPQTYADNLTEPGSYTYTVSVSNSVGESRPVAAEACWVGPDVPSAPRNLKAAAAGTTITLTWDAVTTGVNGGYIDAEKIKYKVVRNPGNVVVASDCTSPAFTDEVAGMNVYTYTVSTLFEGSESADNAKVSVKAGTVIVPPYLCDFSSTEMFNTWSMIDGNNDGLGWEVYPSVKYAYYQANFDEQIDADDYLVSAPIELKPGKTYRLSFDIMSESDYAEVLEVKFGSAPSVQGLSTQLARYEYCEPTWVSKVEYLPEITAGGEYYIAFRAASQWDAYNIYLCNVAIEEVKEGQVWGRVTDMEGAPVADAQVTVGTLTAKTDADGTYTIPGVPSGSYKVVVTKYGFDDFISGEIAVDLGVSAEVSAVLSPRAKYSLSGKVTNHAAAPIANAIITLTGYEDKTATTDANGLFNVDDLYAGDYTLTAHYYALEDATKALAVNADADLGAILLEDKALAPAHVKAAEADGAMTISWDKPVDATEYRHDNGIEGGQIGRLDATAKSVFGSVYRRPATLTSMSWYTNQQYDTHPAVNVFVFDLDESGQPAGLPIYTAENVPNTDGEWTTYEFPTPIDAPRGYMIGLSYEGHLCLGLDKQDGSEEYPFEEQTNCFTMDYTAGNWEYLERHDITRSMMLRAAGYGVGEAEMPEMTTKREYYVIRYSDKGDEEWYGPVDATSYVDTDWAALDMGKYRYGVSSAFESGIESEPALTSWVEKDMTTSVTIELKTNTPVNEAAGATVTLTPVGDRTIKPVSAVADSDAKVQFNGLRKGKYAVSATKKGYCEFTAEADFSTENEYVVTDYCLQEYVVDPFNLSVSPGDNGQYIFRWNFTDFIFDDFEEHTDFTINSPGTLGWEYIDNDMAKTEPIDGLEFPGNGDEMAFLVFNPSALGVVDPAANPHSGEKYLASLPSKSYQNDDFIISPELSYGTDFTLSFWAKSYDDSYGLESFNAGYSTAGSDADSFTWLSDSPVQVPTEWTKYTYTIPAEAKRVAVRCVSEYQFLFMLDDLTVGIQAPDGIEVENMRPDVTYSVYLDGAKQSTGAATEAVISGLTTGVHTLGVKAHFASGDSKLVEITLDAAAGVEEVEIVSSGDVEYYTLTGIRIAKPAKGTICIERRGPTARKVFVR